MKRRHGFAILFFVALAPFCASALSQEEIKVEVENMLARVADLRAQLEGTSATTTPVSWPPLRCLTLARTLKAGVRGDDVRELQRFLIDAKLLASGNATGYFGPLTEKAVREWQSAEGIVAAGSASATGFGVVGPKTRASILSACRREKEVVSPAPSGTTTQSALRPAPRIVSVTSVPGQKPPTLFITAPMRGIVAASGNLLAISWHALNAPASARVSLTLLDDNGRDLGTIASDQSASGSYSWRVPHESTGCLSGASAFDCILDLGQCDGNAEGICSITPGMYAIRAYLSNSISTTSPFFSIAGSALSTLLQALPVPDSATTPQSGALSTTTVANACKYDGHEYAEGSVLTVACEAGHCPNATSGYITGECKATKWCIPLTSNCATSFDAIDVSAYSGSGATKIGTGSALNCPQLGWRVYLNCALLPGCKTGWNICTGSGWVLDPNQSAGL